MNDTPDFKFARDQHNVCCMTVRAMMKALLAQGIPVDMIAGVSVQAAAEIHIANKGNKENFLAFAEAMFNVVSAKKGAQ